MNFQPTEIEVDFRGQAFFEGAVLSRKEVISLGDEPFLSHQIVKQKGRKELTRLRTLWKKF